MKLFHSVNRRNQQSIIKIWSILLVLMLLIHCLLLKQPKMCSRENMLAQKVNKASYRPHSVTGCLHKQLSALGCHFFTCIIKWEESVISKVVSNCKSP